MLQHFEILGTGLSFPAKRVTAEEIERRAGLPAGWVVGHAGVKIRYECVPPETLATMAATAAQGALRDAGLDWNEVDLILDCSTSRHQPVPCNAAILQRAFGPAAYGIPAMDVQVTCLGFIIGLSIANGLLAAEQYRRILLTCSEAGLPGVNWSEPESAAIMGDAAAAVLVGRRAPTPTFYFRQETYSEHIEECEVRGGGHTLPAYRHSAENDAAYRFHMDGPRLFRTVRKRLPALVDKLLDEAKLDRNSLLAIPHQASPGAVEAVRRLLKFAPERFINRVEHMGNVISAGVPAVLHQVRQEGGLVQGQPILLLGTSAGYSQAGLVFTP